MNTPHSVFVAPRKELINGLQKGVVILLFALLVSFIGLYTLVSVHLERQNAQQEKLSELLTLVNSAEEHWLKWLLVGDRRVFNDQNQIVGPSASNLQKMLLSEYRLMSGYFSRFEAVASTDVSASLTFLENFSSTRPEDSPLANSERAVVYDAFAQLEALNGNLLQIGVDLEYERQAFFSKLAWLPSVVFVLIALVVILLVSRFSRQLRSGFASLHHILDHRKHGHATVLPHRKMVDEFTDLSHLIDNELTSRNFDLEQQTRNLSLMDRALSRVEEPFLVTNDDGDIAWMSAGAERLWFRNTALFESIFGIDAGLDDPIGERIKDVVLLSHESVKLNLYDGAYLLIVQKFATDDLHRSTSSMQRFISIQMIFEETELTVLHHALKLMEKDVWNIPVRLIRPESPYSGFAKSLEIIRQNVTSLFESLNFVSQSTSTVGNVTKLQQIVQVFGEITHQNIEPVTKGIALIETQPEVLKAALSEMVQAELSSLAWLSEQFKESSVLGHELALQRLALVEKDLSSDVFLLSDVERCLNEVRAGVLSSLAATEGESEAVRHRFAVDIEHDISQVQRQIDEARSMAASTLSLLESDRGMGLVRLDRAKESINEMLDRLYDLINKTAPVVMIDSNELTLSDKVDERWDES